MAVLISAFGLNSLPSVACEFVFVAEYEEHPVTGAEDFDTIVVKRSNAYLHEATLSHAGQEIGTWRRVISKDRKQMTMTLQRRTPPPPA